MKYGRKHARFKNRTFDLVILQILNLHGLISQPVLLINLSQVVAQPLHGQVGPVLVLGLLEAEHVLDEVEGSFEQIIV